ncbi:MAG: transcriptional regulator, AraC/XylS family protein [Osedax symbiont Rs2]|nr:MAG: transcriptional regulator, AraC/XylS family protein [Osedax symbiont Rs2]
MKQDNQFQYSKSQHLDQVTVLQAQMDDFSYTKHAHEEYSFGVTLAGRQDFFASGAFHRSLPGNIIAFNPGEVHDGHSGVDDTLLYRMLYIHPQLLEPMLSSAGVKQSKDFQIVDNKLDDPVLRQHILNIALLVENNTEDKLQQECELHQMAERIAQRYGEDSVDSKGGKGGKVDQLMLRARDFIHDNLQLEMSLDDICAQIHLSKYHFLRMFRQQFGITPHQYILNARILRAREDLESGAALDDVVFAYGFTDLSHFNRRFKPIYGMTPRAYQQHFLSS